jgi:hypothetical protein
MIENQAATAPQITQPLILSWRQPAFYVKLANIRRNITFNTKYSICSVETYPSISRTIHE